MGSRGPVPKRSDQRHGHRSKADQNKVQRITVAGLPAVPPPKVDQSWHPVARSWFEALAVSGQAKFYEPSDWATAVLIAESMSRDLSPQFVGFTEAGDVIHETIPLKGASLSAYLRAMSVLMVTEGDRRRVSLELARPAERDSDAERADATVTDLRSRLSAHHAASEDQ